MTATATPMSASAGILGLLAAAGSSATQDAPDGGGAFATRLLSVQADAAAPTLAATAEPTTLAASLGTAASALDEPALVQEQAQTQTQAQTLSSQTLSPAQAPAEAPTPSLNSAAPTSPPPSDSAIAASSAATPTELATAAAGIPVPGTAPAAPATPVAAKSSSATDDASSAEDAVPADVNGSADTATPATSAPVRHTAGRHAAAQDSTAASLQTLTAAATPIAATAATGALPATATGALDSDLDDLPDDASVSAASLTTGVAGTSRPVGARSHVATAAATIVPSFGADAPAADGATIAPMQPLDSKSGRSDTNQGQDQSAQAATIAPIDGAAPATPVAAAMPVASTAAPAAAPAPLQEQLARPILTLRAAAAGTHVLTIKVAPEAIGPVTVRAHISPGSLRVEIIAPNDDSSSALSAILPDLKRDLAQGGMNAALTLHQHAVADFSASTSSSGQDSRGETGGAATDLGGRSTREPIGTPIQRDSAVPTSVPIARSFSGDTSLDVLA